MELTEERHGCDTSTAPIYGHAMTQGSGPDAGIRHEIASLGGSMPQDLNIVVKAWSELSHEVKQRIVATVRAHSS